MQETKTAASNASLDQNSDSSVNRRFAVEGLNDSLHAQSLARALTQQPGVRGVELDLQHDRIHVRYDNAMIGVETLVEALRNAGYPPRQRFLDRLKYGWWRYLDENARGQRHKRQRTLLQQSGDASCTAASAALIGANPRPAAFLRSGH